MSLSGAVGGGANNVRRSPLAVFRGDQRWPIALEQYREEHALFAWSTVHGLSSLVVEGQLREIEEYGMTLDRLSEVIVERVFTGLAKT